MISNHWLLLAIVLIAGYVLGRFIAPPATIQKLGLP